MPTLAGIAVVPQREHVVARAEMPAQHALFEIRNVIGGHRGTGWHGFDIELRKGAADVGEQARPFGRIGGAEQLDRRGELAVTAVKRGIGLVRPMDQEDRGDDQMQRDDRGDHQRRDLSADAPER